MSEYHRKRRARKKTEKAEAKKKAIEEDDTEEGEDIVDELICSYCETLIRTTWMAWDGKKMCRSCATVAVSRMKTNAEAIQENWPELRLVPEWPARIMARPNGKACSKMVKGADGCQTKCNRKQVEIDGFGVTCSQGHRNAPGWQAESTQPPQRRRPVDSEPDCPEAMVVDEHERAVCDIDIDHATMANLNDRRTRRAIRRVDQERRERWTKRQTERPPGADAAALEAVLNWAAGQRAQAGEPDDPEFDKALERARSHLDDQGRRDDGYMTRSKTLELLQTGGDEPSDGYYQDDGGEEFSTNWWE